MLRALVFLAAIALGLYLAFDAASGGSGGGALRTPDAAHPDAERAEGPVLAGRASHGQKAADPAPEGEPALAAEEIQEVEEPPERAPDETRAAAEREEFERSAVRAWERRALVETQTTSAWLRPRPPDASERWTRGEDGVVHALRWLAAHQSLDGRFAAADFGRWCEGRDDVKDVPAGAGAAEHDVGTTALGVLAFLGAGYTHRGDHEFSEVVRRALIWLRSCQNADGELLVAKHRTWAWDHACATLALVEAYGMTESFLWREAAQRALAATLRMREPNGVWRYGLRSDLADFSLTLWAALPLVSARILVADAERRGKPLPFVLDTAAPAAVQLWIAQVSDPETGAVGGGLVANAGPALPGGSPRALTAFATLLRLWKRESAATDEPLQRAVATVAAAAPVAGESPESVDMVQRWAGTSATFTNGREPWKTWVRGLDAEVGPRQHAEGDYCALRGSWDPVGAWAAEGGRVAMTACMCLCLEINFRYAHSPFAR